MRAVPFDNDRVWSGVAQGAFGCGLARRRDADDGLLAEITTRMAPRGGLLVRARLRYPIARHTLEGPELAVS